LQIYGVDDVVFENKRPLHLNSATEEITISGGEVVALRWRDNPLLQEAVSVAVIEVWHIARDPATTSDGNATLFQTSISPVLLYLVGVLQFSPNCRLLSVCSTSIFGLPIVALELSRPL